MPHLSHSGGAAGLATMLQCKHALGATGVARMMQEPSLWEGVCPPMTPILLVRRLEAPVAPQHWVKPKDVVDWVLVFPRAVNLYLSLTLFLSYHSTP